MKLSNLAKVNEIQNRLLRLMDAYSFLKRHEITKSEQLTFDLTFHVQGPHNHSKTEISNIYFTKSTRESLLTFLKNDIKSYQKSLEELEVEYEK